MNEATTARQRKISRSDKGNLASRGLVQRDRAGSAISSCGFQRRIHRGVDRGHDPPDGDLSSLQGGVVQIKSYCNADAVPDE
jgi:hypothetical protein